MIPDRSVIGATSPTVVFEVEPGAIRKFAEALGDPNPSFRSGEIAPPAFPTTFHIDIPGVTPDPTWLNAIEEYTFERPICARDQIVCVWRVTDMYEKEGRSGRLTFLVTELEGRDLAGQLVVRGKNTLVVGRKVD
jgi:hypothetical protein